MKGTQHHSQCVVFVAEEGKAADAHMTAAFQDKDDQWDPDADLFGMSDNFEDDEEAAAILNKAAMPVSKPASHRFTPVEGDATVG